MSEDYYYEDYDEDELSPDLRAQLERFEVVHNIRAQQHSRRRRDKRRVRRDIEDWADARRMRDDIDYFL